jgi:hypothetical protein
MGILMFIYSLVLFLILSINLSFASDLLGQKDKGLKDSAFKHCPREMVLAPLQLLPPKDLIRVSKTCKAMQGFCNVIFRDRLRNDPSSSWIPGVLGAANWKMIYFEHKLFNQVLEHQQQSAVVSQASSDVLIRGVSSLVGIPGLPHHPLRPLMQEVMIVGSNRKGLLNFDLEWQERMTDANQSGLAHELRCYMFAMNAVPTTHPTYHWAIAGFRDLFGALKVNDPRDMLELARACGITAAQFKRPNALCFLISTQVDMRNFVELTDELAQMNLTDAAKFYNDQKLLISYLKSHKELDAKSRFDRAMEMAKDLARNGHSRPFEQLSLSYHLKAAAMFVGGGEQHKQIGFGSCDMLFTHVQSLNGSAPQSVKTLLANMYREYMQKYPSYSTADTREKVRAIDKKAQ